MTNKQMREPKEYSGSKGDYREWREVLHAYLNCHEPVLTQILFAVEQLGRRTFLVRDQNDLAEEFELDDDDLLEVKRQLCNFLCKFSTGAAKASILRFWC